LASLRVAIPLPFPFPFFPALNQSKPLVLTGTRKKQSFSCLSPTEGRGWEAGGLPDEAREDWTNFNKISSVFISFYQF
jgi:hypothetical protein